MFNLTFFYLSFSWILFLKMCYNRGRTSMPFTPWRKFWKSTVNTGARCRDPPRLWATRCWRLRDVKLKRQRRWPPWPPCLWPTSTWERGQRRSLWKRNLHCRRSDRLPWWPSRLRASSRPLTSLCSLHPFHFLSHDVRTLSTGSETAWRNLRDTQSATNVSAMLDCLCLWQNVRDCVTWSVRRDA